MGTPEFAVAGLDALIRDEQHVIAVVTGMDKPAGRGQKIKLEASTKKLLIVRGGLYAALVSWGRF